MAPPDTGHVYVCVSMDEWPRVGLRTLTFFSGSCPVYFGDGKTFSFSRENKLIFAVIVVCRKMELSIAEEFDSVLDRLKRLVDWVCLLGNCCKDVPCG